MTTATTICFVVLAIAAVVSLARLALGPSLADRIVAADALVLILLCGAAVASARWQSDYFINVVLAGTILGFVSTVTVARFIERRGAR